MKNLGLMWQVVFKINFLFAKEVRISLLSLDELDEKSGTAIIFGNLVNKP